MRKLYTALALTLAVGPTASAEPRLVTLEEAVSSARTRTSSVRATAAGVEQAEAEAKAGKGQFLPLLKTEGNIMIWDEAVEVSFAGGGSADLTQLPAPQTPYEQVLAGLLQGLGSPTKIQDQVTGQVSVSIVQPITPLFTVDQAWDAYDINVDVAGLQRKNAVRQAELEAATAFYRLHQARELADVARRSVEQLDAQVEQVEAMLKYGMVTENDRLKLRVARAAAQDRVIQAEAATTLAGQALALAMGLPVGTELSAVPLDEPRCTPPIEELEAAMAQAAAERPELVELEKRAQQADLGVDLAWARLAPNLNLVGSYRHVEGQSLADKDSFFVGLMLDWNVFDWGHTWYGIDAARAQHRQVQERMDGAVDAIKLGVLKAWLDVRSAAQSLAVVDLAVQEAEQSFDLETKRYKGGVATTLDLLGAETALTDARSRKVAAAYQCLTAEAALRAAITAEIVPEEAVAP
jgi:outer membrane protein TolC